MIIIIIITTTPVKSGLGSNRKKRSTPHSPELELHHPM